MHDGNDGQVRQGGETGENNQTLMGGREKVPQKIVTVTVNKWRERENEQN